ncbi:hypothetical protein Fmac_019137 [Flemingia macrophylla]|uniref:NAD(P)-binding domain-containing protein n=1 Tax=Flemingia macrophylla TaxID=520843 RepID=A0ABD1M710_9FABA
MEETLKRVKNKGQICSSSATYCVTGGTGYIGSWLVEALLERGYTVHATVRDPVYNCKKTHGCWMLFTSGCWTLEFVVHDKDSMASETLEVLRRGGEPMLPLRTEDPSPPAETLGILDFDAAKTMCRLLSLYHSLTDHEILRLRHHILRSRSLSRLNSADECFLLSLACAERLEDLHLAAERLEDLSARRSSPGHRLLQARLRLLRRPRARSTPWRSRVASTRSLHRAMESLAEMEASERKLQRGATSSQPRPQGQGRMLRRQDPLPPATILYFKQSPLGTRHSTRLSLSWPNHLHRLQPNLLRLRLHRHRRRSRQSQQAHARRSPQLREPRLVASSTATSTDQPLLFDKNEDKCQKARQKEPPTANGVFQLHTRGDSERNNRVYRLAPVTTVGGAGLSLATRT